MSILNLNPQKAQKCENCLALKFALHAAHAPMSRTEWVLYWFTASDEYYCATDDGIIFPQVAQIHPPRCKAQTPMQSNEPKPIANR